MTVDINQLRQMINADEPDYTAVARMGPEVLPALRQFVAGSNPGLAAKAASAASLIAHPGAVEVVRQAAQSASPIVRIAAAGATRRMRAPNMSSLILALTRDSDPGVRKFAIKSAATRPDDRALAARVRELETRDPSPTIRALAARVTRGPGNGRIA